MRYKATQLVVAVAAAASLLSLSACAEAGSSGGGDVKTIKFVAAEYSPKTAPFWQNLAKEFKAKTGITVDVQTISWNDIHQQVSTMVQTNQVPDVLNLDSYAQYAADDLLYPASDVETAQLRSDIPKNLADSGAVDGKNYGIPLLGSDSVLFYNTDLFQQAGITAPPTTMDELKTDALKISKLPSKVGFALSLSPEAPHIDYSTFMFNMGGDYMSGGKWTIDSAKNVAALQYLDDLTKSGATEVNPGNTGRVEGTWQLFEAGTAGMVIGQSGLADRLKGGTVKYATAPFPSSPGVKPTGLAIADYLMAFKKPGNQDAVKKFLAFLYDEKNYTTFIKNEGLLPVTTSAQKQLADDPALGPYIAGLESAKFAPVGEPNWDKVLGEMKNSLGLAVSGKDPKQVLEGIQAVATSK